MSPVVGSDGVPVTTGIVMVQWSPSPFTPELGRPCYYSPIGPYSCMIDLSNTAPGFYTAAVLYEAWTSDSTTTTYIAGTVDFLVAPPLVASTTELTASGGTLTATVASTDGSLEPTGTVDFAEGTTTLCAGVPASFGSLTPPFFRAQCPMPSLSPARTTSPRPTPATTTTPARAAAST